PWVAIADIADTIADSLNPSLEISDGGLTRLVAGPELLTGPELAAALSQALGHPVEWETITPDAFGELLTDQIGAEAAAGIAGFYAMESPPPPPVEMLEFGTTTAAAWARQANWPAGS
ncbi:MAG: hypothetical protein F6K10_33265, partial [Moorea sp. SIO2B7]|nr:hypothetical protein [Moorena sp. SIO2B7]